MTHAMKVERELHRLVAESAPDSVLVRVPARAAAILVGFEGERARAIEERLGTPIHIRAASSPTAEDFEIVPIAGSEIARRVPPPLPGQVVEAEVLRADPTVTPDLLASVDGYWVAVKGDLSGGAPVAGKRINVRMETVGRSFGTAVIFKPREQPAPEEPPKEKPRPTARSRRGGAKARAAKAARARRSRGSTSRREPSTSSKK